MSGRDDARQVAIGFYDAIAKGDMADVAAHLHDDLEWWVQDFPTMGKAEFIELTERFLKLYKDGIRFSYRSYTVEVEVVALELEGYAELLDGRVYNNLYFMRFQLDGAQIIGVREYHDSQHAMTIWGA